MTRAAVLGSGVIGLWTAFLLQKRGVHVRIISDHVPTSTTSAAAASVLTPFLPWDPHAPIFKKQVKWAADTVTYLKTLDIFDNACCRIDCYECGSNDLLEDAFHIEKLNFLDFSAFERIELDPPLFGSDFAVKYSCYMCNPQVFLPWIFKQCQAMGATYHNQRIETLEDVFALEEEIIFNCLGHHTIFPDSERYGVFGQSIFVPADNSRGKHFGVGLGDHAVFRQPLGFYIGSYFVHGEVGFSPRQQYIDSSIEFVRDMLPSLCDRLGLPVLHIDPAEMRNVRAGTRPFRHVGPRLEREEMFGKTLIHHYGHGAHGWTLGYASSRDAVEMVFEAKETLQGHDAEVLAKSNPRTKEKASGMGSSVVSSSMIRLARGPDEISVCAEIMCVTDPWARLSYTKERCLTSLSRDRTVVHVSLVDGELNGFIATTSEGVGREPLIEYVCVKPSLRGSGIGTSLIEFFELTLFPNARNLYLFVSDINPNAARLYQRLGYLPVGALPNYIYFEQTEFLYRKTRGPRNLTTMPPKRLPSDSADVLAKR